jgi:hypothetical protein
MTSISALVQLTSKWIDRSELGRRGEIVANSPRLPCTSERAVTWRVSPPRITHGGVEPRRAHACDMVHGAGTSLSVSGIAYDR